MQPLSAACNHQTQQCHPHDTGAASPPNQHSHIHQRLHSPAEGNKHHQCSALHSSEFSQHAATLLQLSGMQHHQPPSAAFCHTVKPAAASGAYRQLHCMLPTFAPSNCCCCCCCSCDHLTSPQARQTCNNCTALRPFFFQQHPANSNAALNQTADSAAQHCSFTPHPIGFLAA